MQALRSAPMDQATKVVSVFLLKPCHDPASYKVIMVSQSPHVRDALSRALTSQRDVKHYTAPAPASGQEDELQKWIEMLESL